VKCAILSALLAIALVLADARAARAQFVLGAVYPPAYGHRLAYGNGLGFSYHRHGLRVAGFAGGYYSRSVFAAPIVPAWGVLPPISTLTPFGWAPGFLDPGWGVGPGWGLYAPPIVVVQPPIILAGGNIDENRKGDGNPALAFEQLPRPIEPLPRGAKPGEFLVISPKKEFPQPGQMTPEVDRVAALPKPKPVFRFDPFAPKVRIDIELPDPDPVKEAARLVKLGRVAFAAGEYGKAAEQFERATIASPKLAVPHFLKAQAAFAAGRYSDAVNAIRAGLELDAAWPTNTFDPKEPYGASAAAFAGHLAELRKTAAANPGEPALEFLLGYQLWFVGEKAEARKWFDAAAKRLADPGPLALFK
jgi:hypothetical protein